MRKLKRIGLLLFITACAFNNLEVFAQESKLLKGRVFSDSLPPANIHIVNLSLEEGTTSDEAGNFYLRGRLNDSILFSSVEFENRIIILKREQIDTEVLEIFLYPARNELDEVRISDLNLSGVLDQDSEKIKIFDRGKYGIPYPRKHKTQTERRLYTASAGIENRWQYIGVLLGGVPLDAVMNDINGRTRALQNQLKLEQMREKIQEGIQVFGQDFFISELGLPEREIENFVYYCSEGPVFSELIESEDHFQLIELFESKIVSFKELRELE
ncbi:carboxypeptidase-like regulatory domain-containing protein [Gramella sp. GC03-9]|uniref:Carboxypeptidase-like regulatory domain-containing protein n=1 Tax=Christiangramia oceanisediminis TaxID=2920386 RepID=A0A9X2L062_9FLAO|nr:carboxypeptidase-like regulatory domain-containing protein [Gramella oceanisediminis]MCP9201434.1 carboxypeptidase-like regulatory domain-containing protein [Gramella oceanisediminis]